MRTPPTPSAPEPLSGAGRATAIGIVAIACWSALALLTRFAEPLPPFELLSLSFAVAFLSNSALTLRRGRRGLASWRQPPAAWAFAFAGIFAYHAFYFTALSLAPAAQASLIAYLWPLLIVLLSTLTARGAFRLRHLVGAGLGFLGMVVVIRAPAGAGGVTAGEYPHAWLGYAAAAACALVWSVYSVANARFRASPSGMIGGVCGLVALAGGGLHLALEPTVVPTAGQWAAIVLLGIGPVGVAFLAWDHATKHGHMPLLGALSYLTPLVSTILLIAAGLAPMSWEIVAAAALVMLGAAVAAARRGRGAPPTEGRSGQIEVPRPVE
ncbi:EamA family transporter [Rhodobacteraceae bacterium DSL-40]|uniref:DMT family transporter n=1 Tax=Amaricoccus sp. B4 TaxID=3368557 RepID=UPI000DADC852